MVATTTDQQRIIQCILEDATDMWERNSQYPVTERQIVPLRKAFQNCVETLCCEAKAKDGESERDSDERGGQWDEDTKKCDKVLKQLEQYVRTTPVPLLRRFAQSFVVWAFSIMVALPISFGLAFALCSNVYTMPFMVAYWLYILFVPLKHPLKPWEAWRKGFAWRQNRDYFPVRTVCRKAVRAKFDPKKNYFFGCHPHGVNGFGCAVAFDCDCGGFASLVPGIKPHIQTLAFAFWIPFWHFLMVWGGIGDCSPACIKKTLSSGPGESVAIVIGGGAEVVLSRPRTNDLHLRNRKGFVKIALQMGSPLVPVFGFGETNTYGNFAAGRPWLDTFHKKFQRKFGFGLPVFYGHLFGTLPYRRPIFTVIGAPLDLPQISNPTQEDIDKYHKLYVEALLKLYHDNKDVYDLSREKEMQILG